mmetsp:Transcript_44450/g.128668  ORF Transcript_44450/g.128668 Transcript_44450/m.128668 type:complete len:423 (+) Transcript_44450:679-1947(+)
MVQPLRVGAVPLEGRALDGRQELLQGLPEGVGARALRAGALELAADLRGVHRFQQLREDADDLLMVIKHLHVFRLERQQLLRHQAHFVEAGLEVVAFDHALVPIELLLARRLETFDLHAGAPRELQGAQGAEAAELRELVAALRDLLVLPMLDEVLRHIHEPLEVHAVALHDRAADVAEELAPAVLPLLLAPALRPLLLHLLLRLRVRREEVQKLNLDTGKLARVIKLFELCGLDIHELLVVFHRQTHLVELLLLVIPLDQPMQRVHATLLLFAEASDTNTIAFLHVRATQLPKASQLFVAGSVLTDLGNLWCKPLHRLVQPLTIDAMAVKDRGPQAAQVLPREVLELSAAAALLAQAIELVRGRFGVELVEDLALRAEDYLAVLQPPEVVRLDVHELLRHEAHLIAALRFVEATECDLLAI